MNQIVHRTITALAITGALALAGCSSTVALAPDSAVPFAKGELDPSFEDNGNGSMTVKVEHLGEPGKLASGATVYVVWIQPSQEGAAIQNVGALQVDDDYSGELTFTTTFQSFKVMITPEATAAVTKPEGRTVLSGSVSK